MNANPEKNTEKLDIFNDQNKRKLGLLPYSAEAERNVLGSSTLFFYFWKISNHFRI